MKQAKDIEVAMKFPSLDETEKGTNLTCHDASCANLTNRGLQGGNIIFLPDLYMNAAPVS